jgi:hypothetical protein
MKRLVVAAVVLAALAVFAAGCKKKVGDSCTGSEGACSNANAAFFCKDGKLAEMPCRGAGGCKTSGNVVSCDNDVANIGDACDKDDDPACSVDKKSYLKCVSSKFALDSVCRGPKACSWETKGNMTNFSCDTSIAAVGDSCDGDGYACSPDSKGQVHCEGKKFTLVNSCKGPKGCKADDSKHAIECDNNYADVGDPCSEPDDTACASDKNTLLKCKGKKFIVEKKCKKGCSFTESGNEITFHCEG